jgi:amino acid transporter
MAVAKKFGAFAGVFTPSILTILGVIMYMRLGWVVGQAGLITALGIILLSHVISVSTGLSISSIATDKKIRTGGIYYILSRSLGLPMGGSIGITMFVGTSLSIALYIIGFAESFLGIEMIREMTGLGDGIRDYRILGTIMLFVLAFIAYISTSLAIKAQFYIMGAIVLSLASIAAGLFSGNAGETADVALLPVAGGVPVTTVFAVFFPAVTGFTAGVAMSGDLKNPRRSIPLGTMAAIGTGLLVYVGLAVGFALFTDRGLLLTDNNFLMKIAWSSPLVVAGIWGATLSSALGGILGGPRILQAMSRDRITPKLFGKGFGINNEPRNALLMTFLIAEAGILIGELNVVAAIVTMFYIAAYGFINLAFALEKWASADFRPGFRISKWVGIIGFAACFGVMFKLDTPVMFLAMIILAGIYMYIRRKKLELDFGDVWQSVWSSIARSILHRIDRKGIEERNWRPNIILFSGGSKQRPHLIQFGKDLAGKQGFLSNFDLILNASSNVLFKKHQQSVDDEFSRENSGIFTRRHECKDVYEGIEAIASTYGFSGVEPNTILFGWARQSQDPVRFAKMVRTLSMLDLNILMMDYDKDVGFGKREIIDVWCRGGGNNANLVLALVKFMWMSETWKNARVRLLIINPYNDDKEMLTADLEQVLEEARMEAEIKIINNQIEKRPVTELIQIESSNSDIVFLGVPDIREGEEQHYVDQVNRLCTNVGTVVLVKASSYFKNLEIGRDKEVYRLEKTGLSDDDLELVVSRRIRIPEITYPQDITAAAHLRSLFNAVKEMNEAAFADHIFDLFNLNRQVYPEIVESANAVLARLRAQALGTGKKSEWKTAVVKAFGEIFEQCLTITKEQEEKVFEKQGEILGEMIAHYRQRCLEVRENAPGAFIRELMPGALRIRRGDSLKTILLKVRKRLTPGKDGKKTQKVHYGKLVAAYFDNPVFAELTGVLQNWGMISLQQMIKTHGLNNKIFDTFFLLFKAENGEEAAKLTDERMARHREYIEQIDKLNEASLQTFYNLLLNKTFFLVSLIGRDLEAVNINGAIAAARRSAREQKEAAAVFGSIPAKWKKNQQMLNNYTGLEIMLFDFIIGGMNILDGLHTFLGRQIDRHYLDRLSGIEAAAGHSTRIYHDLLADLINGTDSVAFEQVCTDKLDRSMEALNALRAGFIEKIELTDRRVYDNFKADQFTGHAGTSLRIRKLLDYVLQREFILPIETVGAETISWFRKEMEETLQQAGECKAVASMLKNDRSLVSGMPGLQKYTAAFAVQMSEAVKNKTRLLNQIRERSNALADKFSLHAVTKRRDLLRKFTR